MYQLLSVCNDAKTIKGEKFGFRTGILYLSPANLSGYEVCHWRSDACTDLCLNTAGRGAFKNVQDARLRKTKLLFEERELFGKILIEDISRLEREAMRERKRPCVRPNGTSDIMWETKKFQGKTIFEHFPSIQFYDYTKSFKRAAESIRNLDWPLNYHLTFSHSEENRNDCLRILEYGGNVAIVFDDGIPNHWRGYQVVSGDDSDLRFLDPKGCIIGLKAKGKARKDTSGFVVPTHATVPTQENPKRTVRPVRQGSAVTAQ